VHEITQPRSPRRIQTENKNENKNENNLSETQEEMARAELENRITINTWNQGNSGVEVIAVQDQDIRGRTITARALIDEGSDASIASLVFVRKLGFTGKPKEMWIATLGGERREKTEQHQLNIITKMNKIHSLNVWTISNLCAIVIPFNWETIKDEHLHLKDLDLRIPPGPIDLLIGMDHAELLISSQIRRGNKDERYGVLTELGWVVRGKTPEVQGERIPHIF